MLIYDPTGERVRTMRRESERVYFATGTTVPAGVTGTEGTLDATSQDASRGAIRLTTAATSNARASWTLPGFRWDLHSFIFLLEGVHLSADAQVEIAIASSATPHGVELRQGSADARPVARTYRGANSQINESIQKLLPLRVAGYRTIGLAVYPRTNEWAVIDEDGVYYRKEDIALWDKEAFNGIVLPRLSIQTTNAAAQTAVVGTIRLITETW